jgi:SAM-dependent methyltransferase
MLLRQKESCESRYRKHKRELEASLIIEAISGLTRDDPKYETKKINVLEFGCGDGYQTPYLQQIGRLVTSDVNISEGIKKKNVDFIRCNISNAPLIDEYFDIVFSNHVIEHIEDISGAFFELKRIGKPDCLYAFSLPTNIWLLLSIPGEYYETARNFVRRVRWLFSGDQVLALTRTDNAGKNSKLELKELWHKILFTGHGVYTSFLDCYRAFKIKSWQKLFYDNGFSIIQTRPLLLYSSSRFPIIPTVRSNLFSRLYICSSVLFIMKKDG